MLASESYLLTAIADHLHESSKKVNVMERFFRHPKKGTPPLSVASYLQQVKKIVPSEPTIHIAMTMMQQSLTVINLRLFGLSTMVPKVPTQNDYKKG